MVAVLTGGTELDGGTGVLDTDGTTEAESDEVVPPDGATVADGDVAESVVAEIETLATLEAPPIVDDVDDKDRVEELEEELSEQLKSYNGFVLRVDPTRPKLGLGVFGKASCKVNQKVVIWPSTRQAT